MRDELSTEEARFGLARYRKRPVEIQAMHWNGSDGWADAIVEWIGGGAEHIKIPDGHDNAIVIPTLEGLMHALPGDYIIRGVQGEFYPCKPDIFVQTYEPVESRIRPAAPSERSES